MLRVHDSQQLHLVTLTSDGSPYGNKTLPISVLIYIREARSFTCHVLPL